MVLYMAYLFMNLGRSPASFFSRSALEGSDLGLRRFYQKDPPDHPGPESLSAVPRWHPTDARFLRKDLSVLRRLGQPQYLLVVVAWSSVVSIYYYISVIKMMVVKEPRRPLMWSRPTRT